MKEACEQPSTEEVALLKELNDFKMQQRTRTAWHQKVVSIARTVIFNPTRGALGLKNNIEDTRLEQS